MSTDPGATEAAPRTALAVADPSVTDAEAVVAAVGSDATRGLGADEAARRLERDGPNELRGTPPVPAWKRFLAQFKDPLVYLLLVATAISVGAWVVEGAHGVPVDAIAIAAILLINAIIGFVQENRAQDAVAALQKMTAANSTVIRGGNHLEVPSSELVVGDILLLAEGDSVGADARLLDATALKLQEASLTGESEARTKNPATLPEPMPLGDRLDMVYKGTAVTQGVGRAVVTATAMDTEMGAVADMLDKTEQDPSPLTTEIAGVSKMLGIAVVVIALVVMGALFLLHGFDNTDTVITTLLLGVSLAVAAVPEGLPAILTVVLALGVQRLAARKAVVKELDSVETLGSTTVVCSDKTGTLTRNEMTLATVATSSGQVDLTGVGYTPEGELRHDDHDLEDPALRAEVAQFLTVGSLANNAHLRQHDDEWVTQGDPTEIAFLVAAGKAGNAGLAGTADGDEWTRTAEAPFTSERKMMSTKQRHAGDERVYVMSKGAPDVLLDHCTGLQVGDEVVELTDDRRQQVMDTVERLSSQAYRTLGAAYRTADADGSAHDLDESGEYDLVYVGTAGIIDPPRDEARVAVADARRAGIRTVMITGDHPATAGRIASDLGIVQPDAEVLTGTRLDELDDDEFQQATRDVSVYARVAPEHKMRIVDALQADGNVVAMTGDGVNDAPALKSADIGVAMGITGTEVTKEASRMILGDDNFATIISAVRQGRAIFDNIRKFLRYLLSSNMGEVITVFFGVVLAGPLGLAAAGGDSDLVVPLLATQILWINLVTDSGPALAMAADPEIDDVMARAPRSQKDRILNKDMWSGIVMIGLVMGAITLLTIDIFLPGGLIAGTDSLDVARTAGFTTLVLAQLFNALNSRSENTSAFNHLFVNPWLWGALALGLVLQVLVVELPILQRAFGTASLDLVHWAVCVGMASLVLWFDELRKIIRRSRAAR